MIDKVIALRAKAADAAATEAEAMAAAALAAKLILKHGITEDQIRKSKPSDMVTKGVETSRRTLHPVLQFCGKAIASFTDTQAWNNMGTLHFAGFPEDVEMALYLSELLLGAAQRSYKPIQGSRTQQIHYRNGFYVGFSHRINERLAQLKPHPTGTGLVVLKDQMVQSYLEEEGIRLMESRKRSPYVTQAGMNAGQAAGDRVNINRPVTHE